MEEANVSKKALKKLAKKEKKQRAIGSNTSSTNPDAQSTGSDVYNDLFGVYAHEIGPKSDFDGYTRVEGLVPELADKDVWVRGRVHSKRKVSSKLVFITIRQRFATVQTVVDASQPHVPREMAAWASRITCESIVDIFGSVNIVPIRINSCSQQEVEIKTRKIYLVSCAGNLKVLLQDCLIPEPLLRIQRQKIQELHQLCSDISAKLKITEDEEEKKNHEAQLDSLIAEKEKISVYRDVDQSTRLDNRIIDLRTFANQAIFHIQSAIVSFFREFLIEQNFTEIHTPKLLGAASEGGAEVFRVNYFGKDAYLSQSPQLYKQMAISSDFERVFEIGPVFRAENSLGPRHMTEFTGLDIEMQIDRHYHEALDILERMLVHIFQSIETKCAMQLEVIKRQYPFEPIKYLPKVLRLEYPEVIRLLNEAGVEMGEFEDLNSATEKLLGQLIREKYGTELYVVDKFPLVVRPFYTMPDPERPNYANAYDIFMRGEEVCSGSQRIHNSELLTKKALEKGIDPKNIEGYIEAFVIGCPPHAGGGIGLERVLMYYLGLPNIRKTSLFPRDPLRLYP